MFETYPAWVGVTVAAAATLTAVGVIWRMAVKPAYRIVRSADEMLPVLSELSTSLKDTASAGSILREIIGQFRTDSGSSLRDVVDRLETNTLKNHEVAKQLATAVQQMTVALAVVQELAKQDRARQETLIKLVNILDARMIVGNKGVARIEEGAKIVADDLAAAHQRADAVTHPDAPPGTAADAAAQSEPK